MTTSYPALQIAVYDVLANDSQVSALGAEVYDEVPEDRTFPYIEFGEPVEQMADQHDAQGLDVQLPLHVWSDYRGYKEAAEIVKAIHKALDRIPLIVEGFTHVSIAANGARYMRDPEPEVRHAVAPFRVWLTEDTEA